MYSGAFSASSSKWLSNANAIEATEIDMAKCIIELCTLKHTIFSIQRTDSTRIGTKQCMILSYTTPFSYSSMYCMRLTDVTSKQIYAISAWTRYPIEYRCQARHPLSRRSTPSAKSVMKIVKRTMDSWTMIGIIELLYMRISWVY